MRPTRAYLRLHRSLPSFTKQPLFYGRKRSQNQVRTRTGDLVGLTKGAFLGKLGSRFGCSLLLDETALSYFCGVHCVALYTVALPYLVGPFSLES